MTLGTIFRECLRREWRPARCPISHRARNSLRFMKSQQTPYHQIRMCMGSTAKLPSWPWPNGPLLPCEFSTLSRFFETSACCATDATGIEKRPKQSLLPRKRHSRLSLHCREYCINGEARTLVSHSSVANNRFVQSGCRALIGNATHPPRAGPVAEEEPDIVCTRKAK